MLSADKWLKEGNLQEALTDLQASIRQQPANSSYRLFLFQLLAIRGDWQRALAQLDVAVELDKEVEPLALIYRAALRYEALRTEIFAGRRTPLILGEPLEWLAPLFEALRLDGQGLHSQAEELRSLSFEQATAVSGEIDGKPFLWLADADSRLGPVTEIIVNGQYYWVPMQRISELHFEPPADLRDLVWSLVRIIWDNGGEAHGLIPVRYPGSESAADSALALSRKTEWQAVSENTYIGLGQRLWTTDQEDYPLLDIRKIVFNTQDIA